ncbi:DUF1853 family protein [Glaciimonas sp. GNP009]
MRPFSNSRSTSTSFPQASSDHWDGFQGRFHQRWNHLNDHHVRALAWLLDSPDLLNTQASQWQGKIAHIGRADDGNLKVNQRWATWLEALDSKPEKLQVLHAFMDTLSSTRLGLYAEKLMAFYFQQQEILVAHGLQVRTEKGSTVGEFDFLLRQPSGLVHWEFATKFYLLETVDGNLVADDFIGPNLTDSLGQKIQKILSRQLMLSQNPVATAYLTEPVVSALALIKGWLFYQHDGFIVPTGLGVSAGHCRGYWCAWSQLVIDDNFRYLILPKQRWLAPAKASLTDTLTAAELSNALLLHFNQDSGPVLLATLRVCDNEGLESRRGFIVPDDWATRAATTRRLATVKVALKS